MNPNDVRNATFSKAVSGYRMEEVNEYLASVAAYLDALEKENDDMEAKMEFLAEKIEGYREDEESLRAALVGAQKLGDSVVRESRQKAERLLADATRQAETMLSNAQKEADSITANAKYSIETEAYALSRMQAEVAKFKRQMLHMYRKHVELLELIPFDEDRLADPDPIRPRNPGLNTTVAAEPVEAPKEDSSKTTVFQFEYEEITVIEGVREDGTPDLQTAEEDGEFPKRKASRFGELKFGEDYTLTRDE